MNTGTLAVAVLLFGFLLLRRGWVRSSTSWQSVSLAVAVPAFALFALALIQLGRAFSVQASMDS